MVGYGARQHIRKNALQHLHQEITITRRHGSFTLEESLARLVKDGLVDWRDAHARAAHVEEFEQLCPGRDVVADSGFGLASSEARIRPRLADRATATGRSVPAASRGSRG